MDATTISNLALAKIGDQQIMSLDDPTVEARLCKLLYLPTAQEVLRMHDWNWATGLAALSRLSTTPAFDWAYAYALPSDFSRILTMNAFDWAVPHTAYEIIGNTLMTDETSVQITYIKSLVDPNLFDSLFVETLALRLASKLSKPLAGSMDIQKRLADEFRAYLAEARRIDAGDAYPRRKPLFVDSDLVKARYSGVY